jgi:tetratricopeptide (TPR) repeat protein
MQEYIYEETKYIKRKDLKDFEDLMMSYDFMPEEIDDENEFNIVFQYLVNLTSKAPDFLSPYEFALSMLSLLEPDKDLLDLQKDLESRWIQACERIAQKEDIFNRTVEWGFLENRPLIRGLFNKANKLWEAGQIKDAHELFSKIYKTNENDNIGARYSVKATGEGMSYEEFEKRFTVDGGTGYKVPELWEWYGEE